MGTFFSKNRWLIAVMGLLLLLGIALLCVPGYSFSGFVTFGIVFVIALYKLLGLLATRKEKLARILRRLLSVCLCIGLVAAAVTGGFIISAGIGDTDTACDYVIVLGAGVNGTEPSLILSERIGRAYTYLTENPEVICIVSGGQGSNENISEAQCMYDHLTQMGIDGSRIWMEDKSTSTRENLRFSLDLIEEKTGSRPETAAVVSNEFHLFRAGLFAKEQGLETVGIPAKTTWSTLYINYFLREIAGVWYYMILGG